MKDFDRIISKSELTPNNGQIRQHKVKVVFPFGNWIMCDVQRIFQETPNIYKNLKGVCDIVNANFINTVVLVL